MDFLALYICGRFLRIPLNPISLCLAAFLGGIYAVIVAYAEFGMGAAYGILSIIGGIVCVLSMVRIGFGVKGFGTVKASLTYTAVNVGIGGVMTAVYSFAGRFADRFGVGGVGGASTTSPLLFAVAAILSGGISLIYGKFKERNESRRTIRAKITALGSSAYVNLLCDSGNLVREPFSGKPVIIASRACLGGILPEELFCKSDKSEEFSAMYALRARYITVSGVTGSSALICFRPDEVIADGKSLDAAVAIDNGGTDYGGCDGIIPQILING